MSLPQRRSLERMIRRCPPTALPMAALRFGRAYSARAQAPHLILNHRVRGMKRSATLRINELSNELIAQGRCVAATPLAEHR